MPDSPVRIIIAGNLSGPSSPVRISNWDEFVQAVSSNILIENISNWSEFIQDIANALFGSVASGNYTKFDTDGTMVAHGEATCYKDLLQSVTGAQITSPAGDFVQNIPEASVTSKKSARYPTDYITTNWQLNHDMLPGTALYPHIHWWQTTTNTPNWLLAYRWQTQGAAKTTAWTEQKWTSNVSAWSAGSLNQITRFGSITPPAGYGQLSDIVQVRLYRDFTNVSTRFSGADPVDASQDIVNLDVHYEVDMLGSHGEYTK